MDQILDLLDAAAKNYPLKALAPELGKGESTLRNELIEQPGYKLGLLTAIQIWKKTGDFRALDHIETALGRVAFGIPKMESNHMLSMMDLVSRLAKEFGENIEEMSSALKDGVITKKEAQRSIKENWDLIKVCIELDVYLKRLLEIQDL
jgi:hypothetical protein